MVRYSFATLALVSVLFQAPVICSSLGCATELLPQLTISKKPTVWAKYWNSKKAHRKPSALNAVAHPTDTAWSKDQLWGGQEPSLWKPEAVLANAVSEALAAGYAEPGALDVLISIPVKMLYSDVRPYGDGQTNASISFGKFGNFGKISQESGTISPPVVASWITFTNGTHELRIRFQKMSKLDPSLPGKLTYTLKGVQQTKLFKDIREISPGTYEVAWAVGDASIEWGDLYQNHVAYFQPPGLSEVFPVDFRDVVVSAPDLLAKVSPDKQSLGKGNLLDPEQVSVQLLGVTNAIPFDLLTKNNFAQDLNASHYTPVIGIHNDFLGQATAVGNGDTTVILPPKSPFKMAYICFDGRNIDAERSMNVPSGGGWHEIGDPAETVINSLEAAAPIFGYANGKPGADVPYAFGLTDVAVIRRLKPGQALVTSSGVTTTAEGYSDTRGTGGASGRNYHWFIFDQPHEVCAMEWVHPCVPNETNSIGTNCPIK
jgi:hypothetical protein